MWIKFKFFTIYNYILSISKRFKIIPEPLTSSVLFGDTFIIENIYIGSCDLYDCYGDNLYEIQLYDLNPFGIEIYIQSEIGVSTYMYLINATEKEENDGNVYSISSAKSLSKKSTCHGTSITDTSGLVSVNPNKSRNNNTKCNKRNYK